MNPKTEIENKFKNYKTKKILIETNSQNLIIKYDDNNILEYKNNYDFNQKIKKDNYLVKINIEQALINDNKDIPLKIPVATFYFITTW